MVARGDGCGGMGCAYYFLEYIAYAKLHVSIIHFFGVQQKNSVMSCTPQLRAYCLLAGVLIGLLLHRGGGSSGPM